ncbi:MAG: xanthine dehydrogenase accessory protein XdhC [Bdellovibrio sp.]|nr:xanthine dehydrogenase accessory protein XdhC [Bdellovibrio sp.]
MTEKNFESFLQAFEELKAEGQEFVVVTLVNIIGGAPQEMGARMIVSAKGLQFGTVGGGKIEKRSIEEAQNLLISGQSEPHFTNWNLQKDIGMTCGGAVNFFFEIFREKNQWTVAVFGAGHICQELVPLLTKLSCRVICIDPRQEWLDKFSAAANLKLIKTDNMQAIVDTLPDKTFIAISTMGHGTDLPILTKAMKQRARFSYVGNVGSDQKALRLKNDLKLAGIAEDQLNQFFCPIGESIGKNVPIEIALSITSQILKVRDSLEKHL